MSGYVVIGLRSLASAELRRPNITQPEGTDGSSGVVYPKGEYVEDIDTSYVVLGLRSLAHA